VIPASLLLLVLLVLFDPPESTGISFHHIKQNSNL
jgi:hypothetical protein